MDPRGKDDPAYRSQGNLINHAHAVRAFQHRVAQLDMFGYKKDVLETDKYETKEAEFLFVPFAAFKVIPDAFNPTVPGPPPASAAAAAAISTTLQPHRTVHNEWRCDTIHRTHTRAGRGHHPCEHTAGDQRDVV